MQVFLRVLFQADVPLTLAIPKGVLFMHNGLGVVIHPQVRFSGPAVVFQHVTLGTSFGRAGEVPEVGAHTFIGAGAVVVGPVKIGPFSVVGANAVLTQDLPAGYLASGNPARLRKLEAEELREFFLSVSQGWKPAVEDFIANGPENRSA